MNTSITGLTADYQILTRRGFVNINKLKKADLVLSKTPDLNSVYWTPISGYGEFDYNGPMYRFNRAFGNLFLTPDHKLCLLSAGHLYRGIRKWKLESAYTVCEETGINTRALHQCLDVWPFEVEHKQAILPEVHRRFPMAMHKGSFKVTILKELRFDKTTFTEFLAWYLAEGSTSFFRRSYKGQCKRSSSFTVTICQQNCEKNKETRARIEDCLNRCGLHYCQNRNGYLMYQTRLGLFLKPLGKAWEKYFPFDIFDWFTPELARLFIDIYLHSDGYIKSHYAGITCGTVITSSERLAKQLELIALIAGYGVMLHQRGPRPYGFCKDGTPWKENYTVRCSMRSHRFSRNARGIWTKESYSGKLFRISVPTHTLFVKHDRMFAWIGDCT